MFMFPSKVAKCHLGPFVVVGHYYLELIIIQNTQCTIDKMSSVWSLGEHFSGHFCIFLLQPGKVLQQMDRRPSLQEYSDKQIVEELSMFSSSFFNYTVCPKNVYS